MVDRFAPNPTQANILTALRNFLVAVMPDDVEVIAGEPNRVPEPQADRFIVMSPPSFIRLETNIDDQEDVKFTGSIAATVMTVSAVEYGEIKVGASVFGVGVAAGTYITALGTGAGGIGTYTVSASQTITSQTMASGAVVATQNAEAVVQLDFHAADGTSGDLSQTVSTLMRDAYGVKQFEDQSPNYGVAPLYADDPKFLPFINDAAQTEWRWVLDCHLQCGQSVQTPQQFSDAVTVDVVSVDATYPPA